MNGFIKLHRKLTEWEWYDDPNVKVVFLHLLLTANWKEGSYHGYTLHAGDTVIGYNALAEQLGLSVRNVRTAISKLEKTGEITRKTTNKFSVVTIVNWASYQLEDDEATNNRQATDNQLTSNRQATDSTLRKKEIKEIKEINNHHYQLDNKGKFFDWG